MIGLSSSTYYAKPKTSRETRERQDAELRDQIEKVQCEYGAGTGYRYVLEYLRRAGNSAGERKIPSGHDIFGVVIGLVCSSDTYGHRGDGVVYYYLRNFTGKPYRPGKADLGARDFLYCLR